MKNPMVVPALASLALAGCVSTGATSAPPRPAATPMQLTATGDCCEVGQCAPLSLNALLKINGVEVTPDFYLFDTESRDGRFRVTTLVAETVPDCLPFSETGNYRPGIRVCVCRPGPGAPHPGVTCPAGQHPTCADGDPAMSPAVQIVAAEPAPLSFVALCPLGNCAGFTVGQEIRFDMMGGPEDPRIYRHGWLGDGTVTESRTPILSHAYSRPGSYQPTLEVCGRDGSCAQATAQRVAVSLDPLPPPPPPPDPPPPPPDPPPPPPPPGPTPDVETVLVKFRSDLDLEILKCSQIPTCLLDGARRPRPGADVIVARRWVLERDPGVLLSLPGPFHSVPDEPGESYQPLLISVGLGEATGTVEVSWRVKIPEGGIPQAGTPWLLGRIFQPEKPWRSLLAHLQMIRFGQIRSRFGHGPLFPKGAALHQRTIPAGLSPGVTEVWWSYSAAVGVEVEFYRDGDLVGRVEHGPVGGPLDGELVLSFGDLPAPPGWAFMDLTAKTVLTPR